MSSVLDENNPLGQATEYKDTYDASLLFPITRDESWKGQGIKRETIGFHGVDIWNAYEVSWLNPQGKPCVMMAEFRIPAESACLIESKSFKLYLNSFNQTRFSSADEVQRTMCRDLSAATRAAVDVNVQGLHTDFPIAPNAQCIDDIDIELEQYNPDANLLKQTDGEYAGWLCSHLLKSNCPVTSQPDWGSVYIHYQGKKIDEASLLRYIISLRQHQGFHEQCVERIYLDIMNRCQPDSLTVYARYVRRGGLDINPFRCSDESYQAENFRLPRQ